MTNFSIYIWCLGCVRSNTRNVKLNETKPYIIGCKGCQAHKRFFLPQGYHEYAGVRNNYFHIVIFNVGP